MTNFTNKVIKQLPFDQHKQFHNKNNRFIFQDVLVSKGVTSYRHPTTATAGVNDKIVFLGDENQINHFNANPADIAKNIIVSRNGPQWEQVGADINGEGAEDRIGESVSLSNNGSVMAIGASFANTSNGNKSGLVRIYRYRQNEDGIYGWHKIGEDIIGKSPEEKSGSSVSLSAEGTVVAIGGQNDSGFGGHVRVYEFKEGQGSWQQVGVDIKEELDTTSSHKTSLSADGSVVAIANANVKNANGEDSGHVRVFEYREYTANDEENGESKFHYESRIVDNTQNKPLILTENFNSPPELGTSYWIQKGIDIDGKLISETARYQNASLSADGSVVAIGDNPKQLSDSITNVGQVRVYEYKEGLWQQIGEDIDGEAVEDQSGASISLSADGLVMAIGAVNNDAGLGDRTGHVRVYEYREYTANDEENGVSKFHYESRIVDSNQNKPLIITKNFNTPPEPGKSYWIQKGIDIDGEAAGDLSGASISLSADGSIVAIGAFNNDGNGNDSGHVRVFEYKEGSWQQIGEDIDGEAEDDLSGFSVSLSADGSVVVIGSLFNDDNSVRVFQIAKRNPWVQQGLDIDGEAAGDVSGFSVSLSADGSTLAIGASLNDGNNIENSGHVRVYEDINGLWKQKEDDIAGEAFEDFSGWSVSLSADGMMVAIGAYGNDGNGNDSGLVRVYEYVNSSWTKRGNDIEGEGAGDRSGYSVSLSNDGSVLAIGAYQNDGNGNKSGHVRVYEYVNSSWTQRGVDIDGEAAGYESGLSVSLSDDGFVMAIGAINNDATTGDISENRGHVRVFEYREYTANDEENGESKFHYESRIVDNTQNKPLIITGDSNPSPQIGNSYWIQKGIDIDGEVADDKSGNSVSLNADGSVVAIGAPNNDGNGIDSGHVRVYQYNGSSWVQKGGDIQGEAAMVHSGHSVSLSADGSIVAIGARQNNGGSNFSRVVRIYQFTNNMWIQKGGKIDGEGENDIGELINPYLWGTPVSLSADGSIVAIGAWRNDGANGIDSGHVRVYKFTGWGLGSE